MDFQLQEQSEFSLVHVMTRKDRQTAADRMSRLLGMFIPTAPNTSLTNAEGIRLLWLGDRRWLLHAPQQDWWPGEIPACAVTDLSDSRCIFTISGGKAEQRLSEFCPLDFRAEDMSPGRSAITQFEQYPVLLHVNGPDSYDLYVERSYRGELLLALGETTQGQRGQ